MMTKQTTAELPVRIFATLQKWREWLAKNHQTSTGIWLKITKKKSDVVSVTYAQALDEALCHGWIDGQKRSLDYDCFIQKFTPRRPRSTWSKINIGHVARLIAAKKMTAAGLAEIERAKADGRWERAYDSPANASIPDDFLSGLDRKKKRRRSSRP